MSEASSSNITDSISIDNADNALWAVLSKQDYDILQPFAELIDNPIAAIGSVEGDIYIHLDFSSGSGSIEHTGGKTFPTTREGLGRCFTYGGKNPTFLNEHGCGLKSSLAILDPDNSSWSVSIKEDDKIIEIKAPYNKTMPIQTLAVWPGAIHTNKNGSLIRFPIKKDRFSSLYSSKNPKMKNESDLHDRLEQFLSHTWMKEENINSGRIRIFYNGKLIQPFSFHNKDVHDHVADIKNRDITLSTGAVIDVEEITLKPCAKIPTSNMFSNSFGSAGAYLYKNGRLIEQITNGNNYKNLFGHAPHNSHNGKFRIINLRGNQEVLPPTVPTKNSFNHSHPLYSELIDKIKQTCTPIVSEHHVSEESMVIKYREHQEGFLSTLGIPAIFKQEHKFELDGYILPPIDLTCKIGSVYKIYEFKADTKLKIDHIYQLHGNWLLAKSANPDSTIEPILVLAHANDSKISDAHRNILRIFAENDGFKPKIITNNNTELYSFT
jgi:hypothetical protein